MFKLQMCKCADYDNGFIIAVIRKNAPVILRSIKHHLWGLNATILPDAFKERG